MKMVRQYLQLNRMHMVLLQVPLMPCPLDITGLKKPKRLSGYLTDGAKALEFDITQNGEIVDLTTEETSVSNQIIRGGVKIQKRDLETGEANHREMLL